MQKRVVIFSTNQGLYQALSSSLKSAEDVECTYRDPLNGAIVPDEVLEGDSVLLIDCMSLDEKSLEPWLAWKGGGEIVFFNVDKGWDIQHRAFDQQIRGIFFQDDSKSVFIEGMRAILNGRSWFPQKPAPAETLTHQMAAPSPAKQLLSLSPREKEILQLVSVGMNNSEIAAALIISMNTVKTHLYNIYYKINVSNRLQAAIWATAHSSSQD